MTKYGSENLSYEFRDIQATTMSLDKTSQFALLAGRKYLAILSLSSGNNPAELLLRIPYGGKYEISSSKWSYLPNYNIAAIASSQRCDIFELTDSADFRCVQRLKCHTRVLTDLDWSPNQANLLATSSFDQLVHIWDIRQNQKHSEKSVVSLSALDGASQVRWNKWKSDVLASCDGGHIKIWDIRKPNTPSEYIAAHASKINGIEWLTKDIIVSSAQDCTVKFNKLAGTNPSKVKGPSLSLASPIWRARPTPFGRGIVTQCVPHRRDSGLLSLWDWKRFNSPIFTFQAHDIVEFAWKKSTIHSDSPISYELLTWSRDQILRIWTLPPEVKTLCGGEESLLSCNVSTEDDFLDTDQVEALTIEEDFIKESQLDGKENESPLLKNRRVSYKNGGPTTSTPSKSISRRDDILKTEFADAESSKPENIIFEQIEVERGMLRFSWRTSSDSVLVILASFPLNYPATSPTFLITSGGNEVDKNAILRSLKQTAQQHSRHSEPCLKACLQQFSTVMNLIKPLEDPENFSLFPSRGVSNVPFPRTSGARFCSAGTLVCFGRPRYYLKRVKNNSDAGTPRSLSALGPFLSQLATENDEKFRYQRKMRRNEKTKRAGLVTIFDIASLIPFNKELAESYKHLSIPGTRRLCCNENAQIAMNLKKTNVALSWQAASIIANYTLNLVQANEKFIVDRIKAYNFSQNVCDYDEDESNWITFHPLGSELIHTMILHFAGKGDVQTAATLSCLYTVPDNTSSHCHQLQQLHNQTNQNSNQLLSSEKHQVYSMNTSTRQSMKSQPLKQPRLMVPKSWYNMNWTKGVNSPYHTVHAGASSGEHGVVVANPLSESFFVRQHRSNSWSDSLDEIKASSSHDSGGGVGNGTSKTPLTQFEQIQSGFILDTNMNRLYDCFKNSYAEILYRWGFLKQRAEVLKCLAAEGAESKNSVLKGTVDYVIECKNCKQSIRGGAQCFNCKRIVSICTICHIPVKGLSTFCHACGHGGHSKHIFEWFKTRKICPSGCGCACLIENTKCFK